MTPVIPASISSVALIPGTAFTARKNYNVTRCSSSRKSTKHTLSSQRFFLPLPASVRLFTELRVSFGSHNISRIHILSATGTDVAVEEPDSPVANEESNTASEIPSDTIEPSKESSVKSDTSPAPAQSRRSRSVRKSEMPPVTNEELLVGATFTGKVRSIQPFGAFVDFGAFTDGLVHVSQLSDSYVKDVASVVSIGQEVMVRLLEANTETGRISLTMRQSDDSKQQQRRDAPASSDKTRGARKNTSKPTQKKEEFKKSSKFVKGQDLEGTVKNLTRAGAFISLPEGEEGFLPTSEESDDGFGNMMGGSSLQAGQEISVRVLRISRGQVTLTMKKEEDVKKLDSQLNQGVVHTATNPFMLAFRKNKDVAAFLDEREKVEKAAKNPEMPKTTEEIGGMVNQSKIGSDTPEVQDQPTIGDEENADVPLEAEEKVEDDDASLKEAHMGARTVENVLTDVASRGVVQTEKAEAETSSESLAPEGSVSSASQIGEGAQPIDGIESDGKSDGSEQIANRILSSDSPIGKEVKESLGEDDTAKDEEQIHIPIAENEISSAAPDEVVENLAEDEGKEVAENQAEDSLAKDEEQIQTPIAENKTSSPAPAEHGEEGPIPYKNGSVTSSGVQSDVPFPRKTRDVGESDESSDPSGESADDQILSSESEAIVENKADDTTDEVQIQTTAAENEIPSSSPVNEENVEPALEKNGSVSNQNGESGNPAPEESVTKAAISPALVKQLREETGAGMMDCKKALSETGGEIVKALEFLRKKGLASAEKKASRATAEGRIGSYIHDSRIGVLVEVNCETDFVSRGEIFKELVDDIAMQVAACPQVQYLVTEDVPADIVNKERDIEMQKEDLLSKPEQIRAKIVEGRIRKRLEELALLEQPYIKNDKVVIKDRVKQTIATIGENIKVKRFVRYNLGEGLEKKSQDFAAEVAAQTAAKAVSVPGKEQPATAMEANETVHKPPTVTISAALVKQLREETGAGMMDCKKALSETGGDLVKAQEYLRKKGLSAADKKSSRLAAEGRIGSYIHDSRIGVLIEINCETDFVGRSEKFKELVDDLAMQVVACPNVQFVSIEDIPESIAKKEKDLEMQREDLLSKPENIREKIVEGRVSKRLGELALLEQPFIKNDTLLVKDMVKQTVAALGENIKVRRFVRFTLGETIENAETETEI